MDELTFRTFTRQDTLQIVTLLNNIFRVPITGEEWEWFVFGNPQGESRVYLAVNELKNIVGVCGYFPVSIKLNEELLEGRYGHHLALASECRNAVSYIRFSRYQLLHETEMGTKFLIGPPNSNAYKPHKVLMNWKDFGNLDYLYKLPQTQRPRGHNCEKIDSFGRDFDPFFEKVTQRFSFCFSKSQKWMNWRFCEKPGKPYSAYVFYEKNTLSGYIILKRWKELNGQFTLHIIDMHALTDTALSELLAVAESCSLGCEKIDLWSVDGYPYRKRLEELGYVAVENGSRPIAIRTIDGSKLTFPGGPASFMFGDGDQY